jgi:hypothetical protein
MSETLLNELERFFEELPSTVRDDLSFMMVALSDESLVVCDVQDLYDVPARQLFSAQTPIGRLGNLINAVSVFDVYFAMDAHRRFATKPFATRPNGRRSPPSTGIASLLDAYAGQIDAIEAARQRWTELRQTRLTPAAIAAALAPPPPASQRRRGSSGEMGDRAISRARASHVSGAARR